MALILGIETSCDDTGIAVFDTQAKKMLSSIVFSQLDHHKLYGGVVPEIASRSQLEKIEPILQEALAQASVSMDDIDSIAVTNQPGLVGSLLVGICFAKGLAYSLGKKLIGVNHLEGHIFSTFLNVDGTVRENIPFPHISLTVSGGHTSLYLVKGFGDYELIGSTLDDAAGEAFDKIGKILGFGYPCGAVIEKLAQDVNFQDFFKYPRSKIKGDEISFSFSGLKTAVLYHLVACNAYDLNTGPLHENITPTLQQQVSSSLLVCITEIFEKNIVRVFKKYPEIKAFTFGGGVACNRYMGQRFEALCQKFGKDVFIAPRKFCTDNGGMIAFVGAYKAEQGKFSDFYLDASREKVMSSF